MVQLGVGECDSFDRHMAPGVRRALAERSELTVNVGGGIQQEPPRAVRANRHGRLCPRVRPGRIGAADPAGRAPAVPLGEAAAGGGAKEYDFHERGRSRKFDGLAFASPSECRGSGLERRDVGGDFHRDGDDLSLGLGPHGCFS